MKRLGRPGLIAIAVIGLLVAFWAWFESRDREDRTLDDTARREAPGRHVRLSDGFTHFEVAGPDTGDVVVFAAGFSVPYYIWDPLFQSIADSGYRAIRYDYFGRGWSDRPRTEYSQAFYVRQLAELLDSLGVRRPVHIAGLSYGGMIATSFALAHPDRVRSIIYVDAALPEPSAAPARARSWVTWHRYMTLGGGSERMATGQLDDFLHPERQPEWVDRYRVGQQFHGTREAIRRSHLGIANGGSPRPLVARIAESGLPVLILWGAQDRIVSFERTDALRQAIPQATFVTVDSAGHLPHIEQRAVVLGEVLRFLRGVGGTAERR